MYVETRISNEPRLKKTVFKSVGIPYTVVYNKWGEAIL